MKAALLREFAGPIAIEEVETPTPGPGEVLVKVEACGVCHSDLHLAQGDWDMLRGITKLPLIGGHEIASGCPGCIGVAASANTVARGGKRFAESKKLRAVRWMEGSRNM
jgi:propanol-preferring alcohol dehydrogenase